MTLGTYEIGPPKKPNIKHDNGFLDKYQKRDPHFSDRAKLVGWKTKLELAEAVQGVPGAPKNDISDALAAYRHFLEGKGAQRTINYERYVTGDDSGKIALKNMITEAKNAVWDLSGAGAKKAGQSFQFTGSALTVSSSSVKFPYPKTENWQKAIGAHNFWISGDVDVSVGPTFFFDMIMTVHMEDKYNFNPGQADIATGIPDDANGLFSITGLASQYLNVGELSRSVTWTGKPSSNHVVGTADGRRSTRARQPQDNRRARNRL